MQLHTVHKGIENAAACTLNVSQHKRNCIGIRVARNISQIKGKGINDPALKINRSRPERPPIRINPAILAGGGCH